MKRASIVGIIASYALCVTLALHGNIAWLVVMFVFTGFVELYEYQCHK